MSLHLSLSSYKHCEWSIRHLKYFKVKHIYLFFPQYRPVIIVMCMAMFLYQPKAASGINA